LWREWMSKRGAEKWRDFCRRDWSSSKTFANEKARRSIEQFN
jgi:hypothetical protein